jgi:sRNA-binding regulator protein Hfq
MILVFLLNGCLLLGVLSDFRDFVMDVLREQSICISFCFKPGKHALEIQDPRSGYEPETTQQTSHFKAHPPHVRRK